MKQLSVSRNQAQRLAKAFGTSSSKTHTSLDYRLYELNPSPAREYGSLIYLWVAFFLAMIKVCTQDAFAQWKLTAW
uniref:Uncharacterized protein n=1 Tax=Gibberella zeae TaxID=5518 RepID=A0A4E9DBZ1_GIBZA